MTKKRKPYNTYTREFKLEALRLMAESDRPVKSEDRRSIEAFPILSRIKIKDLLHVGGLIYPKLVRMVDRQAGQTELPPID